MDEHASEGLLEGSVLPASKRKRIYKIAEKISDVGTVTFRTFATVLAVATLLALLGTPVGWIVLISALFGLAYCFKDYTEVTTSADGGNQTVNPVLSRKQKLKKWLAIGLSILCGLGLELLLFEGLVAFATAVIAPVSVGLSIAAIAITAAIVLFTMPNDILFYWNCIRKFFNLPSSNDTHKTSSACRQRAQFFYLTASCVTSSFMVFVGCITTFAGIGMGLGPIGLMSGAILGAVLGLIGSMGNFFLQMQAMKELKQDFAQEVQQSSAIQTLTTFNQLYFKRLTERLTAGAMSLSYSVPIVQSIITSPVMKKFPITVTIVLSVMAAVCVTASAFKVGFNYIKRILKVKEDAPCANLNEPEQSKLSPCIKCKPDNQLIRQNSITKSTRHATVARDGASHQGLFFYHSSCNTKQPEQEHFLVSTSRQASSCFKN